MPRDSMRIDLFICLPKSDCRLLPFYYAKRVSFAYIIYFVCCEFGNTPLTIYLPLSLALFHTFLSVRRREPYMMIMFLSLSLSRCCSLSALHTSFNHVYLQLLSMDQIHGSHKVHMSDYVSLSGKHTEKNGAKKMTEDGNRLCLPIKNITNCHFCVSNFQRKTQ